jgi:hypothetical protein
MRDENQTVDPWELGGLSIRDACSVTTLERTRLYELLHEHAVPTCKLGNRVVVAKRALPDVLRAAAVGK